MFFSDYHMALTVALAILLLLSILRLYQIRRERAQDIADSNNGDDPAKFRSDSPTSGVYEMNSNLATELLRHEEVPPLLEDLARKIDEEFGFVGSEFTLEPEKTKVDIEKGEQDVSSRLIHIDPKTSVRFRYSVSTEMPPSSEQLDSVDRLAQAYVGNVNRIQKYKRLADRDPLTGLFNAAYLRLRLKEEIERSKRFNRSVGTLILDVDHFKQINDNLGHLTGDQALKFLANLVVENVRSIDIVCRYGGDELCIILPDASEATIRGTMNRLQGLIRSGAVEATGVSLTVSIGGSISAYGRLAPEALFEEADKAMLLAKRKGRDQCFFQVPVDSEIGAAEKE